MADWAEKKAEAIVDAFLADEKPEDLYRLVQAIAEALRSVHKRVNLRQKPEAREPMGKRVKGRKSRSGSRGTRP